jgi:SAM-dependent methyltransferase
MRESALRLLRCPNCRGELKLGAVTERAQDGHIMSGRLSCGQGESFEIVRGLPRLLPQGVAGESVETAARFGAEWETFRHLGSYDEEWLRNWLDPLGPGDFAGKTVFEGGCGKGRHTIIAARWGSAEIVSVDLGAAAWVAFDHTRALENVHIVQGDLCHPPVAPGAFDVAFSVGVLHHLPEPRKGFNALAKVVRSGGRLAIWVYGLESNEWIVRFVNPVREKMAARMPTKLLYWLSLAPSAALAAWVRLYKSDALAARLPYAAYMKRLAEIPLREVHCIVFDQLVTPIAYYLPEEEVRSWFGNGCFNDVRISWHNQNSWRGTATVRG